ncbi:MAG: phosphatase PAP2 family protein, partial [Proteobacteria bacterium]|nr:phosphatase PAP2 family protein [Pseudomonadota bacterium]
RSVRGGAIHLLRTELRLLIYLTAASFFLWVFLHVMGELREGDSFKLDSEILLALRRPGQLATPIGPRWLQEAAPDVTALGGFTVLTLVVVMSVILLVLHRRRFQAAVLAAAVVIGQVLAQVTKLAVGRSRPDLVPHLDLVYSSSFPSGHSALSPIVYFTLAGILAAGEYRRSAKRVLLAAAAALVVAIGASRVYLGVHWPSDVLAGWALGSLVAVLATLVLHRLAPHQPPVGARAGDAPVAPLAG